MQARLLISVSVIEQYHSSEPGFVGSDVAITGQALDDAESNFGWAFSGFRATTGVETDYYLNAYIAEFRQYRTYDMGLTRLAPTISASLIRDPNSVERCPIRMVC